MKPFSAALSATITILIQTLTATSTPAAYACASCLTGDPTLTAFGAERPYKNRLRLALESRTRSDDIGTGATRIILSEVRTELGLAWAPTSDLFLQVALPLIYRHATYGDSASDLLLATGDLGLRARLHLTRGLALSAGLSIPTAPTLTRTHYGTTRKLPHEAQPGSGSFDPSLGLALTHATQPHAISFSTWGTWPTGDSSPSLQLAAHYQYELWRERRLALSVRLALESRLDGKAYDHGEPVADSGGFIAFAGGDILVTPAPDWLLTLGLRVPIIEALDGAHDEGIFGVLSLAYDL
jgi:hypothetical protein